VLSTKNKIFSLKIFSPIFPPLGLWLSGWRHHTPLPPPTALQTYKVYDQPSDRRPTLLTKIFRAFLQPIDLVSEFASISFPRTGKNNFLPCVLSHHCTAIKE
jgi:hypothetical protein